MFLDYSFFLTSFRIRVQLNNKRCTFSRRKGKVKKIVNIKECKNQKIQVYENKKEKLEEWVVKAKQGDVEAKEAIIRQIHPLLYKMMVYVPKEYRDVQELYQESVLQVLQWIQSYNPNRGVFFIGYIQTMLRYWYLSKRQEVKEYPMEKEKMEYVLGIMEGEQEDFIFSKERSQWLTLALQQLTKKQRIAVWRFYVDEVSLGEIAKELGCSYGVAVKHKQRGLEKLRKCLPEDLT